MSAGPARTASLLSLVLWLVAGALVVVLAAKFVRVQTTPPMTQMARVDASPVVPHVVVLQEFMSAPEGERKGMLLTLGLRGDGAQVERVDYQTSRIAEVERLIFLPPEGFIRTDEIRGTYRVSVMTRRRREPRQQCLASADGTVMQSSERVAGRENIGGYSTLIIKADYGALWLAPQLNCAQLRTRFDFDGGWNERRLVSVTTGEPPVALFDVAGLQEVIPKRQARH